MKKRLLSLLQILCIITNLITAMPIVGRADTYGDLTYDLYNNEYIRITDCNQEATSVEIPSVIEGYPVKRIGYGAFSDCTKLTSVTIPDGVTSIRDSTFEACNNLTNITILGALSIGERAFALCSNLKSIVISDSLTYVGNSAFSGCDSLTDVYYTGSESDWKSVSKGSQNEWLTTYSTRHFNYRFMVTDKAQYADNSINVNATIAEWVASQNGIIGLAVYQNKRLVAVHFADISVAIDYTFNNIPAGDGYTVKVFAWTDLSKIEPICRESEESVVIQ